MLTRLLITLTRYISIIVYVLRLRSLGSGTASSGTRGLWYGCDSGPRWLWSRRDSPPRWL